MITFDMLLAKREEIIALAARHKAGHVRVFGSVARGEASENSDVDLLVSFAPGASLFDLIDLKEDAEQLLGTSVDIVSEGGISPFLEQRILSEAVEL
ncbi:MAG: nucleotidyltransferase family protein [Azospira sp.]|jgi:predicted nucleotidyltransferase|nr:nucleotidyltransferase family protein [Azospira sp.]